MNGNYGRPSSFRGHISIQPNVVVPSVNYGATMKSGFPLNGLTKSYKYEMKDRKNAIHSYRNSIGNKQGKSTNILLGGIFIATLFLFVS